MLRIHLHGNSPHNQNGLQPVFVLLPFAYSSTAAISSTSHRTPFGSVFTATQLLAGFDVKYFPYTSLNAAKSLISARKHVVFNTLSNDVPASFKTSPKFLHTCSVCASIVVASTSSLPD